MTTAGSFGEVHEPTTKMVGRGTPLQIRRGGASVVSPWPKRVVMVMLLFFLVWGAIKVATEKLYTPRSNVGFYLGVVGSLMMLALLAYPVRKHVRFMHRMGALKHWFRWHMILGITGPVLILFHSTFHLRSLNATIALVSMLIVVISGVIGRFVYTQIHYGLYGRRATLEGLRQELTAQFEGMKSRFERVPQVEQWLASFERLAYMPEGSLFATCWRVLVMGVMRPIFERRCARALQAVSEHEQWPEFPGGVEQARDLCARYLRQVERVAAFTTYERLFSLWHVIHIPLIYLLAASSVFHIIAVYMY